MTVLDTAWNLFAPYISFVVIVVFTIIFAWLVSLVIGRLVRQSSPQLAGAARRLGIVVVVAVGGTVALQALGVSPDVLLLMIGLLGVTILVALREPLENYGSKYFSDIYTPFKVGDTIRVQGFSGKVIEINAMTTILLSDEEQLVSVPNVSMIRDVVVNTSPQAWKEVVVPISISGNVDLPAFESELRKSLSKLRMRLDRRFPPVLTTKARTPQSTDLSLIVMLRHPEDRDAVTVEVNRRLTEVLAQVRGAKR
ncbi:MAG TPA: mechanosensitive ion channel domain-containing protein, partial [Thermoplasmata archaeon]|nr:mechanosensitive ion channel domain-containing protein [Thermoplasmata archaeon]